MATLTVTPGLTGIEEALVEIGERVERTMRLARAAARPTTPVEMLAAEHAHLESLRKVADLHIAEDILVAHLDPVLRSQACADARRRLRDVSGAKAIRDCGWRTAHVRLPGGLELVLPTRYLRPSRKGRVGRPRHSGRRGRAGSGCYPVLERLGIRDGVTPATRSEISLQAVLCDSFDEAQGQLARAGLDLHLSTIVRVAVGTGEAALERRDEAIAVARQAPLPEVSAVAGKRLRISVDGGRARTRRTRRGRGIRPGKNKRRPFTLAWREPRVITVDVLDGEGRIDRSWQPIYEVTLGEADETFALLEGVLRAIGAARAAEVVFVSDGADWIWRRVVPLLAAVEIPRERVHLVLDYYHATEHVSNALNLCRNLGSGERQALLGDLRGRLLEPDGPAEVVARLRELARGRRGRRVNREANHLDKHLAHMHYAELRAAKLPIGSGIVESTVRRVINLRFKGASRCWRTDHLMPLMYLRAILKSGRWDAFVLAWLERRHWLNHEAFAEGGSDRADRGIRRAA